MRLKVFYKDDQIADITIINNKITDISCWDPTKLTPFTKQNEDKITIAVINDFLEDRCFEKCRPDKDDLLKMLGLTEYNPLEIVKKTDGRMLHDHISVKIED